MGGLVLLLSSPDSCRDLDSNVDAYFFDRSGRGPELLAKLEADATMTGNKIAAEGLKDMKILFEYLEVFGVLEKVRPSRSSLLCQNSDSVTKLTSNRSFASFILVV